MLGENILEALEKIPGGYRGPEDESIKLANSQLFTDYKKLGIIVDEDEYIEKTYENGHNNNNTKNIFCNELGCNSVFTNVSDYQAHFNNSHRFLCSQCKKCLPTSHLLDLHLLEQHDSYFAVKLARGTEPMFACYLETCKEKFETPEVRRTHCIDAHKFPANYRFDQCKSKSKNKQQRKPNLEDSAQSAMEVDSESVAAAAQKLPYIKGFSFGHHKERVFKTSKQNGKTLECMQELKDALTDVMEQ